MLERKQPWSGKKTHEIKALVRKGSRPVFSDTPAAAEPLKALIEECWDAETKKRPFASELYDKLKKIRSELPEEAREEKGEGVNEKNPIETVSDPHAGGGGGHVGGGECVRPPDVPGEGKKPCYGYRCSTHQMLVMVGVIIILGLIISLSIVLLPPEPTSEPTPAPTQSPNQKPDFLLCGELKGCNLCSCTGTPRCTTGPTNAYLYQANVTTRLCLKYQWSASINEMHITGSQLLALMDASSSVNPSPVIDFALFITPENGVGHGGWGIAYRGNRWFQHGAGTIRPLDSEIHLGSKNTLHTLCLIPDGKQFDIELDGRRLNLTFETKGGTASPPEMDIPTEEIENVNFILEQYNENFLPPPLDPPCASLDFFTLFLESG